MMKYGSFLLSIANFGLLTFHSEVLSAKDAISCVYNRTHSIHVIEQFVKGCESGVLEDLDSSQLNTFYDASCHILKKFAFNREERSYIRMLCIACKKNIEEYILHRANNNSSITSDNNGLLPLFLSDLQRYLEAHQDKNKFDFELFFGQLATAFDILIDDEQSLENNLNVIVACIDEVIAAC